MSGSDARPRGAEITPFPANRRLVLAAERAGRRIAAMHGLVDLDVSAARELIAASAGTLSFTAFVVACVARAAAAHPAVHAYRDWRGRLVRHRHVDVAVLVEIAAHDGPFALPHVLRDADVRKVGDLSAELREVKQDYAKSGIGRALDRYGGALTRIPAAPTVLYAMLSRSVRLRQRIGTVAVSSVGMFGDGGGFAIAQPALMPLQVVVGGITQRPRAVGGRVEIRAVLDLTVTLDHCVVDGAPAARFLGDLRRGIEDAQLLREAVSGRPAPVHD